MGGRPSKRAGPLSHRTCGLQFFHFRDLAAAASHRQQPGRLTRTRYGFAAKPIDQPIDLAA
jgi:hypothetical protein